MMLIVGGPNGAGKSSITNSVIDLFGQTLTKLNADERTIELRALYPEKPLPELNLMAVQQIDSEVENSIVAGKSFYVETVLSSSKYRDDVLEAKKNGYKFALIYVSVYPPELSARRVKDRAKKGGHGVDVSKVIERYHKSHEQLKWFADQADMFLVFDNSTFNKPPILLAEKFAGQEIVHHVKGSNPEVDRVVAVLQKNRAKNPTP
ncbi:MAG: zeta toxin family protein [Alphaproteobacteria bacterium]|nr:zeta toxin family protein [Alphaproteobacteria bacterium]